MAVHKDRVLIAVAAMQLATQDTPLEGIVALRILGRHQLVFAILATFAQHTLLSEAGRVVCPDIMLSAAEHPTIDVLHHGAFRVKVARRWCCLYSSFFLSDILNDSVDSGLVLLSCTGECYGQLHRKASRRAPYYQHTSFVTT